MALVFAILGCGASQPAPTETVDLPTNLGRPVYSVPLSEAPPDVRDTWPLVHAALHGAAPAAAPEDLDEWRRARSQLIQALQPAWGRLLAGDAQQVLFAAITRGLLLEGLCTTTAEHPSGTAEQVDAAAQEARRAYAECVRYAPQAPAVLTDWETTCLERSAALGDHLLVAP